MARSHSQITTGAGARLSTRLGAGGMSLGLAIFAASILLVAPITLWALFGDGVPLRTGAVALAATLVCWVLVRRLTAHHASAAVPAATALPKASPAPPRPRTALPRPPRDVGCPASARRATRRRTRP